MKRLTTRALFVCLSAALFILPSALMAAQEADVVYLEGFPELKESAGRRYEMDFGDIVRSGDSVITGRTDYVELEQAGNNVIRVAADTVFTLQEIEEEGERETVLSTTVGSVAFRFNQITGREPRLATPASVAGVRGTELTVYAGSDGSALFLVDSGLVEVEAEGITVALGPNEGVEVPAGGPPGEKFEWLGRELDFSTWNQERIDVLLEDPVAGVIRVRERLDFFQQEIRRLTPLILQMENEVEIERAESQRLFDEATREEFDQHRIGVLLPMMANLRTANINARYYALSALSLRRYVIGRIYVEVKTRYLLETSAETYQAFLNVYQQLLNEFENIVVPELVAVDI